jgi:hypothetical protein
MKPIENCIKFRDIVIKVFMFSFGLHLLVLIGLVTMFYKLNITSLILSLVFILILTTNYYPMAFRETP